MNTTPPRVLRTPAVCKFCGFSAAHLHRLRSRGEFPPPINLGGPQMIGWRLEDVEKWLAERPTVTQ